MFANERFPLTEHVHTWGPSISAAVIFSGAIFLHHKVSTRSVTSRPDRMDLRFERQDLRSDRHDLRFNTIDAILSEHNSRFDKLNAKIDDTVKGVAVAYQNKIQKEGK